MLPLTFLSSQSFRQSRNMNLKLASSRVIDIPSEGVFHDGEGDLIPGNCREREQLNIKAFLTSPKVWRTHRPSEYEIGLADVGNTQNCEQTDSFHPGLRFFKCLADGGLLSALADLHEASRKRPQAGLGLDGTAAKKDMAVPLRNTACDDLWIMVMNGQAGITDEPG